ncbi:MAG: sulfite exporter TauE/SafE family protein [Deltaproteobacteria bacterium]|nr:sulfite exporter TauE/SafE family protein [Deltaproteobacteria bacterium]MBW1962857.1 sulfite exporter TauE/SafE family protein [Deltaproteobacteria bacterium]MBW2150548.1 sulfite exporter TauE/SafE family protein [Deltaproteobacteria bacterium]
MHTVFGDMFISLNFSTALQVSILGFIGGVLSGFIGSGGAFFMTPGMMNLGVPGVVAVGSNITHKFGKAMVGAKKHGELGNVDKRMGVFLILTAFVGIRIAVWINSMLFKGGGDSHGSGGDAASNLYISMVFICILTVVAVSMLRDALRSRDAEGDQGPSRKIANFLSRLHLPPYILFPVADVQVSLWVLMAVGLATGYLAGTIGVGGFIGVPSMIYVFGVPTAVAAGTELYLAMFMGAFGALNYAYQGFVDIRLTILLYLGSLFGIFIGAYGTKVVKEVVIRIVTGTVILLCVLSRGIAVPMYLRQLGWIQMNSQWDSYFNTASKFMLFTAGITGTLIILYNVILAYRQRRRIEHRLREIKAAPASSTVCVGVPEPDKIEKAAAS